VCLQECASSGQNIEDWQATGEVGKSTVSDLDEKVQLRCAVDMSISLARVCRNPRNFHMSNSGIETRVKVLKSGHNIWSVFANGENWSPGGGIAGLTLADRLMENTKCTDSEEYSLGLLSIGLFINLSVCSGGGSWPVGCR
jgi:hypothetical protein